MSNRTLAVVAAIAGLGVAGFVYGLRHKPKRDNLAAELQAARQ